MYEPNTKEVPELLIHFFADEEQGVIVCQRRTVSGEHKNNIVYKKDGVRPYLPSLPSENQREWRQAVALLGWRD